MSLQEQYSPTLKQTRRDDEGDNTLIRSKKYDKGITAKKHPDGETYLS